MNVKTNGAEERREGDTDHIPGFLGKSQRLQRTGAATLSLSLENRNKMPGTFIREHVHTHTSICKHVPIYMPFHIDRAINIDTHFSYH